MIKSISVLSPVYSPFRYSFSSIHTKQTRSHTAQSADLFLFCSCYNNSIFYVIANFFVKESLNKAIILFISVSLFCLSPCHCLSLLHIFRQMSSCRLDNESDLYTSKSCLRRQQKTMNMLHGRVNLVCASSHCLSRLGNICLWLVWQICICGYVDKCTCLSLCTAIWEWMSACPEVVIRQCVNLIHLLIGFKGHVHRTRNYLSASMGLFF